MAHSTQSGLSTRTRDEKLTGHLSKQVTKTSDSSQVTQTQLRLRGLRLILLDRDGVINFDSPDYIRDASQWHPISGAIEAIVRLQKRFSVAICTNQSGVGRGLIDLPALAAIHAKLNRHVESAGGVSVDVFYCPHRPEAGCACRKPKPELLQIAMRAHDAAPDTTLYAGDSEKDLLAAEGAGCTAALVLTGNGTTTAQSAVAKRAALTSSDLATLTTEILRG